MHARDARAYIGKTVGGTPVLHGNANEGHPLSASACEIENCHAHTQTLGSCRVCLLFVVPIHVFFRKHRFDNTFVSVIVNVGLDGILDEPEPVASVLQG